MLCALCERVCFRARQRGVRARTVTLKLRYADFQTLQRSRTFTATSSEREVFPVICQIFRGARRRRTAIRLLGICLSNLQLERQLLLFDDHGPVHRVCDRVRDRYGYDALHLALAERDRDES
jgi:DNA polymerase-4